MSVCVRWASKVTNSLSNGYIRRSVYAYLRVVAALGRRNYMFFGSDGGGESAAVMYSLIGSCKLNGIELETWLRHVISVINTLPANRVKELLPPERHSICKLILPHVLHGALTGLLPDRTIHHKTTQTERLRSCCR